MATFGMDKGLYQAPQGLPMDNIGPDIEIEIEDPEGVRIGRSEEHTSELQSH